MSRVPDDDDDADVALWPVGINCLSYGTGDSLPKAETMDKSASGISTAYS